MQKDSRHASTSGSMMHNQVTPHQSPAQSFQCSHCVLIFKTKLFLLEHLNKVHGFNVDSALRDAGLSSPGSKRALNNIPGNHSDSSGDFFGCRHCVFQASSRDVVIEHERQCQKKTPQNAKGKFVSSKNPVTKIVIIPKETRNNVKEMSPLQHRQASGAEVNSSSVKSTSKTKCKKDSSKDLKTYKKPSQTITKFFKAASGSNGSKPALSLKSPDHPGLPNSNRGTIILHKSHSSSSPNNDGVFKVAATSMTDLTRRGCDRFLLQDHILNNGPLSHKADPSDRQLRGPLLDKIGKRPHSDSSLSPEAKKTKTDEEMTGPSGSAAIKMQSLSNDRISFEVSEDEEERNVNLVNGDTDRSQIYCCKHCDYSDTGIHSMLTHYQEIHPYIRYKSEYIQDPNDWSATFRCLECPVEFSTVIELKRHYKQNHPDAPDVFCMQAHELQLVFKCFVCAFTTNGSRVLKEHYQENHPTHKVNSSLMYCRYSANRCQEGSPQLNTCEKNSSPKHSDRMSHNSVPTPSKEIKTTPPRQSTTSKGADAALYQCRICKFSHKSVIVMHVHYQKSHPAAGMTIDKIKQSALAMSHIKLQVTPEKILGSPTLVTVMDKSPVSPDKTISTKDKPDSSDQKISLSFTYKDRPEASPQTLSKSSKNKDVDSAEVKSKRRKGSGQRSGKLFTEVTSSSSSSPQNEMFYCCFCNYSSTTVKSVIGHHNSKHTGHAITGEDILMHSAEMQNRRRKSIVEASASSQSSEFNTQKVVKAYFNKDKPHHEDGAIEDTSAHGSDPYQRPQNLFFCPKCNFGHTTMKGVLNHQVKRQHSSKSSTYQILKYTAVIREEIKKSKFQAVKSSLFSSGLPLPLLDDGDEGMVFCHLCNSKQKSLAKMTDHYKRRHPGFKFKTEKVLAYSSMVHEQTRKLHQKTTVEQAVKSLGQSGNESTPTKKLGNSVSISPSFSKTATPIRSLQCRECTYKTQHVYLLRRHLRTIHKTGHTIRDVLQMCFNDGALQSGYHCEWCVFSHKDAARIYQHCQEKHTTRGVSLEHITASLYVGPTASTSKKKKSHLENAGDSGGCDEMAPPQPSGKNETITFHCKACSFKGFSLNSLTSHYRAVHPWSVKEDGSVLDVISKKPGVNRQGQDTEDYAEISESFDSYQVPLEFETLTEVSPRQAAGTPKLLKCRLCSAGFHNRHGLHTHYGKKHPGISFPRSDDEQEVHPSEHRAGLRVYKCPRCTYVNARKHGTLTHCQMRHPTLTVRAKRLETDEVQLPNMDEHVNTEDPEVRLKFSGFMCKICPIACPSLKKLKTHYEQDHNQSASNILKPAPKHSAIIKKQLLSKYHSAQGAVLQGGFFKSRKYAKIKCQFCKYVTSTKIALSRHLQVHHKNASVTGTQDSVYKCCLCSYSSAIRKYLAKHYSRTHGKAAFMKYYVPVHQILFRKPKPAVEDRPKTQHAEETPETCQSSTLTGENKEVIYSCPRCTYVNTSYHGTLTHCQMMHPNLTARADDLATVEIQLSNMDVSVKTKGPGHRLTFSGHMCKLCPLIRASLKKLKIHYEQDHNQILPNTLKAAPKHPAAIKKQLLSKYHGTQGSVPQGAFFKKRKYAVIKCSFCKYVATTKIALSRHVRLYHRKASEAGNQDSVYKCSLCSYSSIVRIYLGKHYNRTHGKAAFLKYYVPVHQKIFRKPKPTSTNEECSVTQHTENTPETCLSSTLTTRNEESVYKCRLCTYSSQLRRYLSSHYKQKHGYAAFSTYFLSQYKPEMSAKCDGKMVSKLPQGESEQSAPLTCKKCPNLLYQSSQLLSVHYTHFHSSDIRVDFTVLPRTSKKGSKMYKCNHCGIKINSTGELCCHLDHHRELYKKKANAVKTKAPPGIKKSPEAKSVIFKAQDEPPVLQTVQELTRCVTKVTKNVTKVEMFTLPTSPLSSPSHTPEPQLKSREEDYTCKQCGRTFMSLTGLRVHEHSHAAMAALKRLDNLPTSSKQIFNKYIRYQSGTVKPFRCRICPYRTNIISLLKNHLLKKHEAEFSDIVLSSAETDNGDEESTLRTDRDPPNSSDTQEFKCLTESQDEYEIEKSVYSEPPDVQRQLNHYSFMAQASASAQTALQKPRFPQDSLFQCEFCNFTTGHLSSLRRHYLNRHGKKIMKCKDCCFFTALRKNLEMHIEMGHSNCPSEPTHLKDLRCPLCLYQTKNKNNMIDHIVLHREERVIPIEVCRPKLSRYLQGIVFRCHKCTFTSASAENLRLHMLKHDDIKPYKCRLCYFDCTQLSDLEAHLCDKHQVMRNHELVGQINLNQLVVRANKMSEEEEGLPNSEQQSNKADDIETNIKMEEQEAEVEIAVKRTGVSHENQEENTSNGNNGEYTVKPNDFTHYRQGESQAENDNRESTAVQNEEAHQMQEQVTQEDAESLVKSATIVFQCEDTARRNSVIHQKQEQDIQELQAGDETMVDAMNGQEMENIVEQKIRVGNRANIKFEDGKAMQKGEPDPNEEWKLDENRAQHNKSDRKQSKIEQNAVAQQGQETTGSSSTKKGNIAETTQARKLHKNSVQDTKVRLEQSTETKLENDILCQILELDEEGSMTSSHSLQKGSEVMAKVMPIMVKKNHMLPKNSGAQECPTAERIKLTTTTHNYEQGEIHHKKQDDKERLGDSLMSSEDQAHIHKNTEPVDPYGDMPVLENEYLKEDMDTQSYQRLTDKEEEWSDHAEQEEEGRDEIHEDNVIQYNNQACEEEESMEETDNSFASTGAFAATAETDTVLHPSSKAEKPFSCKYCGRNLINSTELERHIIRHGM